MHSFLNLFGDLSELTKNFFGWLGRIKDALFGLDDKELKGLSDNLAGHHKDFLKSSEMSHTTKMKRGRLEISFSSQSKPGGDHVSDSNAI